MATTQAGGSTPLRPTRPTLLSIQGQPRLWRRLGWLAAALLGGAAVWLFQVTRPAPPPPFTEVRSNFSPSEAFLLDRHGEVLHTLRVDFGQRRLAWTPLAEVSPALTKALITTEDRRFFQHRGVDWRALAAAAASALRGGPARGASTLTMQVAAILDPRLTPPEGRRGLKQKLRQLRAALALEQRWSKAQILETYLNLADFRGELKGIAATAAGLFGKSPAGLDEAEAVLLAAILPSPGAGAGRIGRRACAIAATGQFQTECAALRQQALAVLNQPPRLPAQRGEAPQLAQRLLHQAGERIRTTLDARLQRQAAAILKQQLAGLEGHNARDGAAVVVDNASGDVLAYVGSAGPLSSASQVDGVSARRQAGSTLKPFLYGLALEKRYLTAASLLQDTPLHLETTAGLYLPQNYERDFKGWVSVRTALGSSLNIPAVRVLLLVGVEPLRDRLRELGYRGLTEAGEFYGYALALGAAEVSLLEQVKAYRTLANGGLFGPLRLLPGAPVGEPRRVMSPQSAFLLADILSDRTGRAVTFGLSNPLATRFWTAVKTGTSNSLRDNWCIGFSRRYTVGVWVGNFEGDAMRDISGVSGAAPAWLEIMNALHQVLPSEPPPVPAAMVATEVRFEPAVEPARREWFIAGTETGRVRLPDPATRPPHIEAPPDGVIIALDPDIPRQNQAVLFASRPARGDTYFLLDGVRLAPADRAYQWLPLPGRHTLELVGRHGEHYHRIDFQVRLPGG